MNYMDVLTEQSTLADELSALSCRQAELIEAGRAEAVLELLAARERLMDRIVANQGRLAALEGDLAHGPAATATAEADRRRIRELAASVVTRLSEIVRRDESDRAALQARRDEVGAALNGLGAARRARHAYFDARRVKNRFADRQG